jgi:hypothetical protein
LKLPLVASAVERNTCTKGQETQLTLENAGKKKNRTSKRLKKKLPQLQLQRGNKRWRNKTKYLEKSNERRYVDSGISTSFVCQLRALTSSNDPLAQRIIAGEVREKGKALRG